MGHAARPARRVRARDVRRRHATRFRPGYYPFTEPSVAFDIGCLICGGRGLPGVQAHRLADDPGRRHGPSRSCCATAASIPSVTRASPSAWASTASPMLRHGISDIRSSSRTTCASWSSSSGNGLMRVPLSWLRDYVDFDCRRSGWPDRLTLLGMEVQGIEHIGDGLDNQSSSASCSRSCRIPNSDRLVADQGPRERGQPAHRCRSFAARPTSRPASACRSRCLARSCRAAARSACRRSGGTEPGHALLRRRARPRHRCRRHPDPRPVDAKLGEQLESSRRRRRAGRRRQAQPRRRAVVDRSRPRGCRH